ncbi:NUDIX domain-containing protein, partial [bacterium]|nr:NUDIX domain-containing protein [bacterium]
MINVILVDKDDNPVGVEEKLAAHLNGGKLHRAFSVFLYDPDGNMLLQRRSAEKYHSPELWSNACCGHPQPGEET